MPLRSTRGPVEQLGIPIIRWMVSLEPVGQGLVARLIGSTPSEVLSTLIHIEALGASRFGSGRFGI